MNKTKSRIPLWLWLAVLSITLAACRPGFPTGKFVRSEAGINRNLIFMNGGRWEGYFDGNLTTFGEYRIQDDRIHFESDHLCEQAGAPVQAEYVWSFADDSLSFTPVEADACAERAAMLSAPFQPSQ